MKQSIAKFAEAGITGLQVVTGGKGCKGKSKKSRKSHKSKKKSGKSRKSGGGGCCYNPCGC